jgi:glutamine synthetase
LSGRVGCGRLAHLQRTPASAPAPPIDGQRCVDTTQDPRRSEKLGSSPQNAQEVLDLIESEGFEFIDLRFIDLPGVTQHTTFPTTNVDAATFENGIYFDGSSVRGFQGIQESDMLLMPDPTTAVEDTFRERKTLMMYCHILDPITGEAYSRDPRNIARKAEAYLASTGIADTAFMGPEAEFFIFDSVRFDSGGQHLLLRGGLHRGLLEHRS